MWLVHEQSEELACSSRVRGGFCTKKRGWQGGKERIGGKGRVGDGGGVVVGGVHVVGSHEEQSEELASSSEDRSNLAVVFFHVHEYANALFLLETSYQNIEPIDERISLHVCLLLLDVALACQDASKAADVIQHLENFFGVGHALGQGDSGSNIQPQSNQGLKFSGINDIPASNACSTDFSGSASTQESALTRTLSDETLEYVYIQHWIRVQPLLLTRNLKAAMREIKLDMIIACFGDSSVSLLKEEDDSNKATSASAKNLNHKNMLVGDSKASNATSTSIPASNGDFKETKAGNPLKALSTAKELQQLPNCSRMYIFLGHVYAAEALSHLNQPIICHYMFQLPYRDEDREKWKVDKSGDWDESTGSPSVKTSEEFQGVMFMKPEEAHGVLYGNLAVISAAQGNFEQASLLIKKSLLSALPNNPRVALAAIHVDLLLGLGKKRRAPVPIIHVVEDVMDGLKPYGLVSAMVWQANVCFLKGNVVRLTLSNRRKGIIRIDSALRRRTPRSFVAATLPSSTTSFSAALVRDSLHCPLLNPSRRPQPSFPFHSHRSSATKDQPFWVSAFARTILLLSESLTRLSFYFSWIDSGGWRGEGGVRGQWEWVPMKPLLASKRMTTFLEPSSFFQIRPSSVCTFSMPFRPYAVCCSNGNPSTVVLPGSSRDLESRERKVVRLGLPSKGRMADETLSLLKNCQLSVRQLNPRQYVADIPQLSNLEVWFQRPKDIVFKIQSGDLDLGIVGFDTVCECGQGNDDLIVVHEALGFGACRLSIAIPKYGIFENVNSLGELAKMPQWTKDQPLRIETGFSYLGNKFFKEKGFEHVRFQRSEGALEAYPAMGTTDAILDLVSSGTTLRENNLKEIEGGVVLESQAVLVASRRSLNMRKGALEITHEMLERLEAHLRAIGVVTVVANMRGNSAEEVAERVLSQPSLSGLQGPTISPVFRSRDGKVVVDFFAIVICVPQRELYKSVQQLRSIGGSGVLVSDLTYIFEEETPRWRRLLSELGSTLNSGYPKENHSTVHVICSKIGNKCKLRQRYHSRGS
ncbi:ATP phosphoribosyltransferase [Musa troglodytarum]|uniref:ATP phosphoribosyltransferase n=1 Tax=Musa troglodytarum TaxID=320322 RepID=A0A9E7EU66_9LILI|nr:ATP phosphoribosyltransferase [Musa troglodytarum]